MKNLFQMLALIFDAQKSNPEIGDMQTLTSNVIREYAQKQAKVVYVTLQEFLENGGILEKERRIFTRQSLKGNNMTYEKFEPYGYYLEKKGDHHLAYNAAYKMFPMAELAFYVEIQVAPLFV